MIPSASLHLNHRNYVILNIRRDWIGAILLHLMLCVHIENKDATRIEMAMRPLEDLLPLSETGDVINRVEWTHNRVEALGQIELGDVSVEKLRLRRLLSRDRKHPLRIVNPDALVSL